MQLGKNMLPALLYLLKDIKTELYWANREGK